MSTVLTFPTNKNNDVVFGPETIQAMSMALEDVCRALKVPDGFGRERAVIAERIVELARRGERDSNRIFATILKEAGLAA